MKTSDMDLRLGTAALDTLTVGCGEGLVVSELVLMAGESDTVGGRDIAALVVDDEEDDDAAAAAAVAAATAAAMADSMAALPDAEGTEFGSIQS